MNPAPTPRTDAKCSDYAGPLSFVGDEQFLPADFARTLERELTSAQAALAAKDAEIARLKAHDHFVQKQQVEPAIARAKEAYTNRSFELLNMTARAEKAEAEVQRQTDHIDLMRDEFQRIAACPSADAEIKQLCRRGIEQTIQRTPVIAQRDKAEAERDQLRCALAAAKEDTERLELLAVNAAEVRVEWDDGEGPIPPEFSIVAKGTGVIGRGPTLRAAIDAARKAQP